MKSAISVLVMAGFMTVTLAWANLSEPRSDPLPTYQELALQFPADNLPPTIRTTVLEAQVKFIRVTPFGMLEDSVLPDPVLIGAGAIDSPAHQARVVIETTTKGPGSVVPVKLIGGRGHSPGTEARLVMKNVTATGGFDSVLAEIAEDGRIEGVLTSSDVVEACTIRAGDQETQLRFTEDQVDEGNEWTGEYVGQRSQAPGVYMQHVIYRHHRWQGLEAPWKPLDRHKIRLFVEELEWIDTNGVTHMALNTVESPSDLSAWANYPTNGTLTDKDGRVSVPLTITAECPAIVRIYSRAYDWSVWKESTNSPALQQAP